MQVGIIADTHGIVDPELLRIFRGVGLILHGGDVGTAAVLRALEGVAPVKAVLGNVDDPRAVGRHPRSRVEEVSGVRVYVTHQIGAPGRLADRVGRGLARAAPRVLVFGHSHRAYTAEHDGVLFLNPGGAGPRRFGLPRSVGLLHVGGGVPRAEIILLDELQTARKRG